jgi:hypothetical protein
MGFGIALGWPQYKKHKNIVRAQQALDLGKEIAFHESKYKERTGRVLEDFTKLDLSVKCASQKANDRTEMVCSPYVYWLKDGHIVRVDNTELPEWFEMDIDEGTVACSYMDGSWAGEHICDRMDLSSFAHNLVL